MTLTMLGTGCAVVTDCYNTCFVLENNKRYFLVDGGGGIGLLRQLKYANISWKDLREIFVTHKHLDHILGILWMIRMITQSMRHGEYEGDANIYGHDEVIGILMDFAEKLLDPRDYAFLGKRLHLITLQDGETRDIIGKKVTFFDIHSTKAKQFGFSMELSNGGKLTCCGDEPYTQVEKPYAGGSEWLLCEAFCMYEHAYIFSPYEKHHSTVKDACTLAEKLGAKNLILYHTEDKNIQNRKELYTREGKEFYKGNLFVPEDLEKIEIE